MKIHTENFYSLIVWLSLLLFLACVSCHPCPPLLYPNIECAMSSTMIAI